MDRSIHLKNQRVHFPFLHIFAMLVYGSVSKSSFENMSEVQWCLVIVSSPLCAPNGKNGKTHHVCNPSWWWNECKAYTSWQPWSCVAKSTARQKIPADQFWVHPWMSYRDIICLEPIWPLFLKVNPPKQGRNSNQNRGHLWSSVMPGKFVCYWRVGGYDDKRCIDRASRMVGAASRPRIPQPRSNENTNEQQVNVELSTLHSHGPATYPPRNKGFNKASRETNA